MKVPPVTSRPSAVKNAVVGQPPQVAQLVDGGVLAQLQPEADGGHLPVIPDAGAPGSDRVVPTSPGRAIDAVRRRTYAGGADRAEVPRDQWGFVDSRTIQLLPIGSEAGPQHVYELSYEALPER